MKAFAFVILAVLAVIPADTLAIGGKDLIYNVEPATEHLYDFIFPSCHVWASPRNKNMVAQTCRGDSAPDSCTYAVFDRVNARNPGPIEQRWVGSYGFYKSVIEVSDKGPAGYINIARYNWENANTRVDFSKDSGSTFSPLAIAAPTAYPDLYTYYSGFGGGGGHEASFMKFAPNGDLWVFFFSRNPNQVFYPPVGENVYMYSLNLQIFDMDGVPRTTQGASLGTFPVRPTEYKFMNDYSYARWIQVVMTDVAAVAIVNPYEWKDTETHSYMNQVGFYSVDLQTGALLQKTAIGYLPTSSDLSDCLTVNPMRCTYKKRSTGEAEAPIRGMITTDGYNLFLMTRTVHVYDPIVGEETTNFDFFRFEPLQHGVYLPENTSGYGPNGNFVDLSSFVPKVRSVQFMHAYLHDPDGFNKYGRVLGFVAPRFDSNWTNQVDIYFEGGQEDQFDDYYMLQRVQRVRLDPNLTIPEQEVDKEPMNDIRIPNVFYYTQNDGWVEMLAHPMSHASVYGGTLSSFCETIWPEITLERWHYFMMDIS